MRAEDTAFRRGVRFGKLGSWRLRRRVRRFLRSERGIDHALVAEKKQLWLRGELEHERIQ